MDQNEFVEAIKIAVIESSKKSVESVLLNPPGRQPNIQSLQLSNWFNSLTDHDKEMLQRVIRESVETTVFGFFCVLDGIRAIEDGREKGSLLLYYEKHGERFLLNNPKDDFLHDLL